MGKEMTIKCTNCATEYRVHEPEMLRVNGPGISQVTLFSTVGLDERACPKCRTFHAPACGRLEVQWIRFEKKPNLVAPTPRDMQQILKAN